MKETSRKTLYLNVVCTVILLGVFAVTSLILISVGGRLYKNIDTNNVNTYKLRTSLSYIATKVHQMDAEGCVKIEKRNGVDTLVMQQDYKGKAYETLVYFYEGKLYEVFHERESKLDLSRGGYGYEITEVDAFTMTGLSNTLIQFTAADEKGNEESITLNLKSRR